MRNEILRMLENNSRIDSVSYTHLDVYKRQIYVCLSVWTYKGNSSRKFFENWYMLERICTKCSIQYPSDFSGLG